MDIIAYDSAGVNTIKYNNNGIKQWSSSYNELTAFSAAITTDKYGNVYTGGVQTNSTNNSKDYFVSKNTTYGNQQWLATYDGPDGLDEELTGVAADKNGRRIRGRARRADYPAELDGPEALGAVSTSRR